MIPCSVAGSRWSALLGQSSSSSATSRSRYGARGEQVLTTCVLPTCLTTITCMRYATFSHHFRTPCLYQGPPSSQPNWLLLLGVANNSLLALARHSIRGDHLPTLWLAPFFGRCQRSQTERESALGISGGCRINIRHNVHIVYFGIVSGPRVPAMPPASPVSALLQSRSWLREHTNPLEQPGTGPAEHPRRCC